MVKTRDELKHLISLFKEKLEFANKSLIEPSNSIFDKITPSNVKNPIEEFGKVNSLIKAHTTKVGIIFNPENLRIDDFSAAYTTLENLINSSSLILTLYSQLTTQSISNLFKDEIKSSLIQLSDSLLRLVIELALEFGDETSTTDEGSSAERLQSVGIIWSNCDLITKLILEGEIGALTSKIKTNITLIEDGFEEFVAWTENPTDFDDDDDPFGLGESDIDESDSDEDEIDGTDDASPPTDSGDDLELIKFSKLWVKQIELIKLLLASFKKSLPATTSGATIDEINTLQRHLVVLIDKFISDIMMDQYIDDTVIQYTKDMIKTSKQLSIIAQNCHRGNEKKVKWYETWSSKFEENSK